jgi:FtsH-binding integral membrane protein
MAGALTGVLVSQFHLIGVHPPFLAGVLIVVIAVVLCLAEMINPRRVPRGVAAGLTYTVVAGMAVWRWDSSRADLWYVAESGVILGLGVFLATRVREPRTFRRILPGVVLTLLGWGAMGVLFAIYQGDDETAVANAAFFAGLATVVAGAIATALQAVAARDVGSAAARSWRG